MKYNNLKDMDLKLYQVPMLLSRKLFQLAQWEEEHDDYWTKSLLECAQHALALEDQLVNKKEADNVQDTNASTSSPTEKSGVDEPA